MLLIMLKLRQKKLFVIIELFHLEFYKILTFKTHLSDESLSEKLEKIGIHNPDDKILIDSFKTAKNLKRFVNFITRDKGILENSKDISNIFDSKVFVFAPEQYINN